MKFKKKMFSGFLLSLITFSSSLPISNRLERIFVQEEDVQNCESNRFVDFSDELNLDENASLVKQILCLDDKKYLIAVDTSMEFKNSVFYDVNQFYLGADPSFTVVGNSFNYALARVATVRLTLASKDQIAILPIAPRFAYLNGGTGGECPEKSLNPIYNSGVTNLTLSGRFPVLTLDNPFQVDGNDFLENQLICLVNDVESGASLRTNTVKINDSQGNESSGVVKLAASGDVVFAAVKPQSGGFFGSVGSGFAALITFDKRLKPLDVVNASQNSNLAANLDLSANSLVAMTQDAFVGDMGVEGIGDMYWDSVLNRLYISLVDVRRSNNSFAGGVVSILVARMDSGKLIIEPCVDLDPSYFIANSLDFILGFYFNDTSDVEASIFKVRTMHTSTKKSYLILNGGVEGNGSKIYALPIVPEKKADDSVVAEEDIGKIADKTKDGLDEIVSDQSGMSLATEEQVLVGGSSLPIPIDSFVEDMFIVNDAVFVCVAGDRSDPDSEAGIFRSTPIFDKNGKIRGWSAWQRVMGNTDSVFGAGLDKLTGNFWYLTQDDSEIKNTAKVTFWGEGDTFPGLMGNGLVSILSDEFTFCNGGVHQIFNFDEFTPGFNFRDKFSMMVATGKSKVALIETGRFITNGVEAFTPTKEFIKDENVFIFDDNDLVEFGPICCAQVSRTIKLDQGWVFVGGNNGLLVLSDSDGLGWDSSIGLDELRTSGFPGDGSYHFKKLYKNDEASFLKVRKLSANMIGDNSYLYIMTTKNIYRVLMDADKFDDAHTSVLNEKTINCPPGTLLDMQIFYAQKDEVALLVATSFGLFYSGPLDNNDVDQNVSWSFVNLSSGQPLRGPIGHLSFVSRNKGGYTMDGNLYVLASDLSLNLSNLYRFDLKDGMITPIVSPDGADYYYSIGDLRNNFVTDGALGFFTTSKNFERDAFLRKIGMIKYQLAIRRDERVVNLDVNECSHNVGVMVLNTASGGWVVPGDWGIRVSE